MALKSYKPTTPGQRGLVLIDRSELWKGRPVKNLTEGLTKKGGRNNTGRITARRRGGGAKRLYRIVDFKRNKFDVAATVERIEYDPNRTAFIALVRYEDGEQAYILAPQRLAVGDSVVASAKADIKPGNAMPFSGMPIGTIVHNIELKPGKGGQIARAAGTYAQFVGRDGGYAQIRLSSGELRMVRQECMATVGAVSNPDNSNQNLGKAGRVRHMGKRPSVRGVAMNPIDHPHGGGEGRTSRWPYAGHALGQGHQGQAHPGQEQGVAEADHPLASRQEEGALTHGTLCLERAFCRQLCPQEGREVPRVGPQRGHQDLVAPLHHPSPVRGPHLRGLQRSEAYPGERHRGHDRPEVRGILADADLLRPRRRQESQEEVSHGQG
jgi:large subunit ribosomal protein L2